MLQRQEEKITEGADELAEAEAMGRGRGVSRGGGGSQKAEGLALGFGLEARVCGAGGARRVWVCLDTGGVHGKNEWNASDGQGWGQRDRDTTHRRKSSDGYHTGGSGVLIIVQKRGRKRAIKERAGGT